MSMSKKNEEATGSFYQDKASVVQEARVFNETPVSPRKCRIVLTKVLYLLSTGETFGRQEATSLFFGCTKLFQNKDPALRQMVYLAIKELCTLADDVIMVTASIMKDMQPNVEVVYRPNAIRALSRVVDPSMVQGLERFFKSAIVDRNTSIASAALVSSYQLQVGARDVVRRWGNEVQEALSPKGSGASAGGIGSGFGFGGASFSLGFGASAPPPTQSGFQSVPSSSYIVQYHALGLLYLIRSSDRMAVTKLVQQLSGATGSSSAGGARGGGSSSSSSLRSPMALCMLVRYAAKIADDDPNLRGLMLELLEGWLRHKSDMVNYEAARAICEMRGVTASDLSRPIAVLQLFLSSSKQTLRFAAIRTLAKLAQTQPAAVAACNVDMENLITDPNRSVATYAITTLLKTGTEASVDRLMKQISSFMGEISDEFKVIVVDAIRSLCLKFPAKQVSMLAFLSGVLRDEGGYEFKRAVVEAIFDMIRFIADCKEAALAHLCEFIEDCEFTKLSVRILHVLGSEGPKMMTPQKYIRYIYNRVILENAIVRAAAVNALAKFGVADKSLSARIEVLLQRCLDDVDDEVRDRAALNLRLIQDTHLAQHLVSDESLFKLNDLEHQLHNYLTAGPSSAAFDASSVQRITKEEAEQQALRAKAEAASKVAMASEGPSGAASTSRAGAAAGAAGAGYAAGAAGASGVASSADEARGLYQAELSAVPQLSSYGPLLKSTSRPVELTERETEYVVTAVKHVFAEHIVLQFNVTNTHSEVVLEDIAVVVGGTEDAGLTEDFILPVGVLNQESPSGKVYVSFTRQGGAAEFPQGQLSATLRFTSKEVDPSTGEAEEEGFEDSYEIEAVELGVADYVNPRFCDFNGEWSSSSLDKSATETYSLTAVASLKDACDLLVPLLGLEALGGTETPTSTNVHTLNLAGSVVLGAGGGAGGGASATSSTSSSSSKTLVRARMTYSTTEGVGLELAVKADSEAAVNLIMSAI
ncbi:unnamed protein product [Parajaminaea phylloscopi]